MIRIRILFVIFTLMLLSGSAGAQYVLPQNFDYLLSYKTFLYSKNYPAALNTFTSAKPYLLNPEADTSIHAEKYYDAFSFIMGCKAKTWTGRKLYKENLLNVASQDFSLHINPLFNFTLKRSQGDSSGNLYQNTRGLMINGTIGKNLYFETSYYENQASFPGYVNDYITQDNILSHSVNVIPGQGIAKNFKSSAYDYGVAYGLISLNVLQKNHSLINLQAGHGKNFYGDGYRSMLLSDFSPNYPFLKTTLQYNRWQYQYMVALFKNIIDTIKDWNAGWQEKPATFHYLSYNASKAFQISFFEATIWQPADVAGHQFRLDIFNPVPLFHTLEYNLDNVKGSTMIGLNLSFKSNDKLHCYSQVAVDRIKIISKDLYSNRTGFQLGLEGFDIFNINNLNLQAEYNQSAPYTYYYFFSNYNYALAHPIGANFRELLGIVRYHVKRFFVNAHMNYATYGLNRDGIFYGKNILQTTGDSFTFPDHIGQGLKTNLKYADICFSYLLNPLTQMNIFTGVTLRNEKNSIYSKTNKLIYFGIRTSLMNEYFDF